MSENSSRFLKVVFLKKKIDLLYGDVQESLRGIRSGIIGQQFLHQTVLEVGQGIDRDNETYGGRRREAEECHVEVFYTSLVRSFF